MILSLLVKLVVADRANRRQAGCKPGRIAALGVDEIQRVARGFVALQAEVSRDLGVLVRLGDDLPAADGGEL